MQSGYCIIAVIQRFHPCAAVNVDTLILRVGEQGEGGGPREDAPEVGDEGGEPEGVGVDDKLKSKEAGEEDVQVPKDLSGHGGCGENKPSTMSASPERAVPNPALHRSRRQVSSAANASNVSKLEVGGGPSPY